MCSIRPLNKVRNYFILQITWELEFCRRRQQEARKFKKRQRLLKRKHHFKIELWFSLSVLQLFPVGHYTQNRVSILSLVWHEKQRSKDLLLRDGLVVRTKNTKISRLHLADYVKTLHQKACRTFSTIICPHSTCQIIDLWCCRSSCPRHFLNSLLPQLRWRRKEDICIFDEKKTTNMLCTFVFHFNDIKWVNVWSPMEAVKTWRLNFTFPCKSVIPFLPV